MKKIADFLPEAQGERISVQASLDFDLHERVADQFRADREKGIKMTWGKLIEAAAKSYLAERGKKVS